MILSCGEATNNRLEARHQVSFVWLSIIRLRESVNMSLVVGKKLNHRLKAEVPFTLWVFSYQRHASQLLKMLFSY